ATNNDGSLIFALLHRHSHDGESNREHRYLARWNSITKTWSETYLGPENRAIRQFWRLKLSSSGRWLSTHDRITAMHEWGELEAKKHEFRRLWDATDDYLQCLNDAGFPTGDVYFDPTGQRLLQSRQMDKKWSYAVYDSATLTQLHSQNTFAWENHCLSRD